MPKTLLARSNIRTFSRPVDGSAGAAARALGRRLITQVVISARVCTGGLGDVKGRRKEGLRRKVDTGDADGEENG